MPKIEARLAPMRSCMMADCLRSTQPSSAATFRTKSITNRTRPKAMARSISMLGARRRGAGEWPPVVADELIAESRECRHRLGELAEDLLGAVRRQRFAEHRHHAPDDLPFGQRLAEGLDRLPEALHPSPEIGVRAFALDPGGRRQHPVRVGTGA